MDTTTTPRTQLQATAHDILITNLRNAHALEKQVIAVLEPQLDLIEGLPDLHARVAQHIEETEEQVRRLQTALESCGSAPSMMKDTFLSVMGRGQSSVQGLSDDGVIKAVIADMMTEHLEIATYRSLMVVAEMAGRADLCLNLELSLSEEVAMADWFNQNLEQLTRRFVELEAAEDAGKDSGPDSGQDSGLEPGQDYGRDIDQGLR